MPKSGANHCIFDGFLWMMRGSRESGKELSMPIYEYRCENCGHEMEAIRKLSDAPLERCPVCEKESLKKKISAAVFRLKGGGWYETDFKSGDKRNVSSTEKSESKSADSDGSSDSGSTKKTEEKSSAKKTDAQSDGNKTASTKASSD